MPSAPAADAAATSISPADSREPIVYPLAVTAHGDGKPALGGGRQIPPDNVDPVEDPPPSDE